MRPIHEAVQTAERRDAFGAGAQHQVIGVGQHDIAPVARTASGASPFTVACVPTGMKAGVATAPCGVMISPRRAPPCVARRRKEKGSGSAAPGVASAFALSAMSREMAGMSCSVACCVLVAPRLEQEQQPFEQLYRTRRATANMEVDGYHAGDPADDCVASMVTRTRPGNGVVATVSRVAKKACGRSSEIDSGKEGQDCDREQCHENVPSLENAWYIKIDAKD